MEEPVSIQSILINVAIQIGNLVVLFLVFKYLLWDKIHAALQERKSLIKKLESANTIYEEKLQEANQEVEKLLAAWLHKKESIVAEAKVIIAKKQQEMMDETTIKVDSIIKDAEKRAASFQSDLEKSFEEWLKRTSIAVVTKLLQSDKNIESKYLETIIKDLHH